SEIVTSIDDMRKKCVERKEILSKTKSSITLSLEVLDKCLEKLEQLTLPGRRVNIIYKRIPNEEKIFAVRKIEEEIKYGKVSKYGNKLFFHSLSLSEVPNDSSLIWFDELKQCATATNLYTFMEICCNKSLIRLATIKMFDKQRSHHFIKMCTGEYGPSFKEASFEKGIDSENFESVLHIENFVENSQKCSRLIEYNFSSENKGFSKCQSEQMFLFMNSAKGDVSILLANSTFKAGNGIIGKVISPTDLKDCINYDHSSFLKILDCGIILEV
ncbi:hypothetical protein Avbf_14142, partial [Armadillidium vulgare]